MLDWFWELTLGNQLLELLYAVMGLIAVYTGVKNLRDEENPHPVGTCVFWSALGVIFLVGKLLTENFPWGATAIGALGLYISDPSVENFQPMNINFSIISPLEQRIRKKAEKNLAIANRSLAIIDEMIARGL